MDREKRASTNDTHLIKIGKIRCEISGPFDNLICDECDTLLLRGSRKLIYKCLDCPSFDLCADCYPKRSHSAEHRFNENPRDEIEDCVVYGHQSRALDLTRMPVGTLAKDPWPTAAVMPPSGIMAPWAPVEDVEPPYWVGNLDCQERAVYGNVQHIRCMGLRLCSSDPLDQPPRTVPPGYRYIGGSMIGMMRNLNRSFRNALKDRKLLDAMVSRAKRLPTLSDRSPESFSDLEILELWQQNKLGMVNPPARQFSWDLLPLRLKDDHAACGLAKNMTAPDTLPQHFSIKRGRSNSLNDTLRSDLGRTGTRNSWSRDSRSLRAGNHTLRRSRSQQTIHESEAWITQDIALERAAPCMSIPHWPVPWLIWSQEYCSAWYQPLVKDEGDFTEVEERNRLMILLPSRQRDAPIRCGIVSLPKTWERLVSVISINYDHRNSSNIMSIVFVNGCRYKVPREVEMALRDARLQRGLKFIYYAPLCVGQSQSLRLLQSIETADRAFVPPHTLRRHAARAEQRIAHEVEDISKQAKQDHTKDSASARDLPNDGTDRGRPLRRKTDPFRHDDNCKCYRFSLSSKHPRVATRTVFRSATWADLISCASDYARAACIERGFRVNDAATTPYPYLMGSITPSQDVFDYMGIQPRVRSADRESSPLRDSHRRTPRWYKSQRHRSAAQDEYAQDWYKTELVVDSWSGHTVQLGDLRYLLWRRPLNKVPIKTFQHSRIDYEQEMFFCILSPSTDPSAVVQCGLFRTKREAQSPSYMVVDNCSALDDSVLSTIMLCGLKHWISSSVEVLLRAIRHSTRRVFLWLPTICIGPDIDRLGRCASLLESNARRNARHIVDAVRVLSTLGEEAAQSLRNTGACDTMKNPSSSPLTSRNFRASTEQESIWPPIDFSTPDDRRLFSIRLGETRETSIPHLDMGPSTSKDYTALSYCWGAMSEGQTTWVNGGHEVKIQNNLFDFLSLFSSKRFLKESLGRNASSSNSRGPLTWADALSINQNDLLEKSRELRRIGRTYSSAGQVLVWLGRELWEMKTLHFLSASPSLWQRPIHQDTLTFVRKLSAIPYFFRGWCTQELILAPAGCKGTGVVMNQHIYCWHVMESLIGDLPLDMIPVAERALVKKVKRRLLSIKKLRAVLTSKARTPTYLTLLLETSDCQCTMPVDKLYSLWSLACDARVLIPYPEYTGKVTETIDVFVSFTRFWIRHYKRLDILTFARHHDHEGLPSWVADWSQSSTGYKHILASTLANDASRDATIRDVEDHKLYCADGGATLPEEMLPVGPYNKTLTCYVNYTDHIAFVEELAPEFASSIESGSVLARVRTLHEHLLQSLAGDVSFRRQTLLVDMLQASILGRHYLEHRRVVDITEAYRFSNDVDSPAMAFVTSEDAQDSNAWEAHADSVLAYRRYAITQQGHVGLVPPNAKIGDAVNVIVGCSIPIVLRTSRNGSNRCEVVGESYFQDMMDGQMALTAKCSEIELV